MKNRKIELSATSLYLCQRWISKDERLFSVSKFWLSIFGFILSLLPRGLFQERDDYWQVWLGEWAWLLKRSLTFRDFIFLHGGGNSEGTWKMWGDVSFPLLFSFWRILHVPHLGLSLGNSLIMPISSFSPNNLWMIWPIFVRGVTNRWEISLYDKNILEAVGGQGIESSGNLSVPTIQIQKLRILST